MLVQCRSVVRALLLLLPLLSGINVRGQANLPVYTSHFVDGFQNYSWATVNVSAAYGGTNCISVTNNGGSQAVYYGHPAFPTAAYNALDFWINGGATGGQALTVGGPEAKSYSITLQTNVWQHFTIPLSSLGSSNATNCGGFWIQGASAAQPVFYVGGMQLLAAPAPALVHLNVNATNVIRTADPRWFGLNTAVWDGSFDTVATSNALLELGCTTMRYPGGSLSDTYHWMTDSNNGDTFTWPNAPGNFMQIATNLGAQVYITANYGTGTSNEAAAWVASANVTNQCHFKYWEIGNESYGSWEVDSNSLPHDPYTYAMRAAGYIKLMKAVDPTIKIGVPASAGEDSYANYTNHAATNPITGAVHYGWTPVMLTTFKNLGVYPDFLDFHHYPQVNGSESDALLLQVEDNYCPSTFSDWASSAQNLQMQLTNYLGAAASNVEVCATENNAGGDGKQSTSVVDALYMGDSLGQLMKTEINSMVWWDLVDGPTTNYNFDPTLYGWRAVGDLGIHFGTTNYPAFYAKKLLNCFAGAGDSVVNASSDYVLLSDYAVHRTNGALTLLVINKDVTTNFNAQIILTNFVPASSATIQSYGIAQDEATRTNAPAALQDVAETNFPYATTNFTYSFPAGTLTLFTFAPAPVTLHSSLVSPGKVVVQYQGQANVPYVLQQSSNLVNWISVSTNTSSGAVTSVTNMAAGKSGFWRAAWVP